MIENGSNISLVGLGGLVQHSLEDKVNEYNFTSYEDDQNITFLQSTSAIQCKSPFAFVFNNIMNLFLQNMTIQNCGANATNMIMPIQGSESFPNINSVAFLMISITDLRFEYTSVQNSTGYGFVGINMLGCSQLVGSSFVGNNQYIKNTQLMKYSYKTFVCNDASCATPSVIYATTANVNGKINYPGGNAIFIYNHLMNRSHATSLEIESCLFTLGVDDSIALIQSLYIPSGDRIMGTGLGVLLFLGPLYSVPINIANTISYRNQAGNGANFNFHESYENSVITLSNVSSTRGISPWFGGGFYYKVDNPALDYDTASSITFNRCNVSSDCLSGGSINVHNVRSLKVIDCRIYGQLNACCRNGTISITRTILQTESCIGGIQMRYYNVNASNCTFNGAGLMAIHGTADVADSLFTNCQSTAVSLFYSSLQLRGNVLFTYNSGAFYGGALSLLFSTVTLQAPANITFLKNSALGKGGVAFVTDEPFTTECSLRFIDPDGNLSSPGIHIFIDNSSAGIAGNVLYGGNVEGCTFDCSKAPHYCNPASYVSLKDIFVAITHFGQYNGNQSTLISSDATGVYYCVNDTAVFDTQVPISAYPGEKSEYSNNYSWSVVWSIT